MQLIFSVYISKSKTLVHEHILLIPTTAKVGLSQQL